MIRSWCSFKGKVTEGLGWKACCSRLRDAQTPPIPLTSGGSLASCGTVPSSSFRQESPGESLGGGKWACGGRSPAFSRGLSFPSFPGSGSVRLAFAKHVRGAGSWGWGGDQVDTAEQARQGHVSKHSRHAVLSATRNGGPGEGDKSGEHQVAEEDVG